MSRKAICRIMIQASVRLDTLLALFLLLRTRKAEAKYPGIRRAKIVPWTTGTISPDGKSWRDYLAEGTLLVGVGGGPLDEHPSAFGNRKAEGLSTCALVARDLGVDKHPLYRRLIQQVTAGDLKPSKNELDLSVVLKAMHRNEASLDQVIRWTFEAFDDLVSSQKQFLDAVKEAGQVELRPIDGPRGLLYVGLMHSDNEQMWAAVRHYCQSVGKQIVALIQRRSSGRVQIFGNRKLGVGLKQVAAAIRHRELWMRGGSSRKLAENAGSLDVPGQLPLIPIWCYQVPGENLLNGSETAPGLEPTRLDVEEIFDLVCAHILFEAVGEPV